MARRRFPPMKDLKFELTSMIDVTFLILVFFMCTLKFKTLDAKLLSFMPLDRGPGHQEEASIEPVRVILRSLEEDRDLPAGERRVRLALGGDGVLGISTGRDAAGRLRWQPADAPQQLLRRLKEIRRVSPESKAILDVDARAPSAAAVFGLDELLKAEFEDISYAGIPASIMRDLQRGAIR